MHWINIGQTYVSTDPDVTVRRYAIKSIAEIGDASALPKLREIAGSPNEVDSNRKAARAALKQLGKRPAEA
ncbi:MAG: HEAT repeat domain-containing protein [Planctomycetes bacterium]|nr:HEAT repeat domain-containing protein [Planctomycetota bacterium]